MEIVVGSVATKHWLPEYRTPSDIDIWTDKPFIKSAGYDYKNLPSSIISLLDVQWVKGKYLATLDTLYTIKCSHLGWDNPMWNKHKQDVLLLKSKGATLDITLYLELLDYWKEELGDKSFLSLKKDKKSFFQDNVTYVYEHDWLHEQVSYPQQPVYKSCLGVGEEVLIDKIKFDSLHHCDKVRMFREEIAVIAVERWLVNPKCKGRYGWVQAYIMSLRKTITSLTKGWASEFIILHLEDFVKPDYSYFKNVLIVVNKKEK